MKTFASALLLATSVIGANAFAGNYYVEPNNVPFQGVYGQADSSVSRAQVQAELAAAKAAGLTQVGETTVLPRVQTSNLSREQVQAELAAARANGDGRLYSNAGA